MHRNKITKVGLSALALSAMLAFSGQAWADGDENWQAADNEASVDGGDETGGDAVIDDEGAYEEPQDDGIDVGAVDPSDEDLENLADGGGCGVECQSAVGGEVTMNGGFEPGAPEVQRDNTMSPRDHSSYDTSLKGCVGGFGREKSSGCN